jgi:hypothetical protein
MYVTVMVHQFAAQDMLKRNMSLFIGHVGFFFNSQDTFYFHFPVDPGMKLFAEQGELLLASLDLAPNKHMA